MPKTWVVALSFTLATYSDVSAAPHAGRVFPAALRATPPPRAETERMEAERIAALLDRDRSPAPAVEIAARWTHDAPYPAAALVGDRVVWAERETFRTVSLRDGALVRQVDIPGCSAAYPGDQQTLYARCADGVAAVDPETLAVRWRQQAPEKLAFEQLVDAGGALLLSLAGADPGTTELLALGRDGEARWRTPLPSRRIELRSDGAALFAFEGDPTVWRIDPRSGRVSWTRASDQPIVDVVALASGLTAVVRPEDLLLLDGAGRELVARPRNPRLRSFTVRDARLFSCVDDGTLHATDLQSGRELWWAQVSVPDDECAVLGATDDRVLVEGAGRLLALDTTRPAPRAPAVTIRGVFHDLQSDKPKVRGVEVFVGDRRVRTDRRGRFVATVRAHGPIAVHVDGAGSEGRAVVWPDAPARHRVELSNYVDDSCH